MEIISTIDFSGAEEDTIIEVMPSVRRNLGAELALLDGLAAAAAAMAPVAAAAAAAAAVAAATACVFVVCGPSDGETHIETRGKDDSDGGGPCVRTRGTC